MNKLTINLKSDSKIPLYEQIYDYIKNDIQTGRIAYGEKLPSTRSLSRHLEVSRSTVELAYEQLLSEGYIESRPCRGFFVSEIEELYSIRKAKPQAERQEKEQRRYRYDFTPNGVDLKSFPYNVWRKLSREILSRRQDGAVPFRQFPGRIRLPLCHMQLPVPGARGELHAGAGSRRGGE